MNSKSGKQFERLGEKLIADAEAITCSIDDFYAGLRMIQDHLSQRIQCESYDKKGKP